jgi:hypothetical protein
MFKTTQSLSLSWTKLTQSTPSYPISLKIIWILCFHIRLGIQVFPPEASVPHWTLKTIALHMYTYTHTRTHVHTSLYKAFKSFQVSVLYIRYNGNWTLDCRENPERYTSILYKKLQTNLSKILALVFVTCKVLSTHKATLSNGLWKGINITSDRITFISA